MEKATGLKLVPFFGANYNRPGGGPALGQSDFGWFTNFSGWRRCAAPMARFRPHLRPHRRRRLHLGADRAGQSKTTLDDVLKCDKTLTSASATQVDLRHVGAQKTYLFSPKASDVQKCFKTVKSANHGANLMGTASGVLDVATGNSTSLRLAARARRRGGQEGPADHRRPRSG